MFGEDVVLIDSFIKNVPKRATPLWYLGSSILLMSKADVVYFAKGWKQAPSCIIENNIANTYDVCCIQTD
jgi:hypothetical protein